MRTPEEKVELLRAHNASLLDEDEELAEAESVANEGLEVHLPPERAIDTESIIMRRRRPVLAIKKGQAELVFQDPDDIGIWKKRLEEASGVLGRAIAAVGRIELTGHPDFSWIGTGWLVHERYLVTNRHVAEEFALRRAEGFEFQTGLNGEMKVSIDLLQEIGREDKQIFRIHRVSYIEERPGLDLAFLEVEQIDGEIAKPIELSTSPAAPTPLVATIGYPAFDSRIPEPDLMKQIYGDVYDKKRLAPGAITEVDERRVLHNCTTLGGNSGSAVIDLKSGQALGLHFSGSFLRTNYAVRGNLVKERLDALVNGTLGERPAGGRQSSPRRRAYPVAIAPPPARLGAVGGSTSITIPLVVTVSLGEAAPAAVRVRPSGLPARRDTADEADDRVETESKAKPEDYDDRAGYVPVFLGEEFAVDLPEVEKAKGDVLTFGSGEHVLKYEHFSVVMNERRRMCFFSACNIDGARSKGSDRTPWRYDPRIPRNLQIMKECYGNPPKFSRGHMTRREDPAWGKTASEIQRGADDSMHVTNTTPQMQSFNSPIWLALEDYALQHAREAEQKISVFTGPYFRKDDPTMYGIRIPVEFWKVIAFVHDETGELCSTGYEMSQENNLEQPEFVFGDFVSPQLNMSTQVAISTIEAKAGVSFGDLADFDPMSQEGAEAPRSPLLYPEQIRFI